MSSQSRWAACALLLLFILAAANSESGQMDYGYNQVTFAKGQNVAPVFEGWERNPDVTFNMVFGYMNRNYEENLDIPIGPDNNIEPGGPDQGQPTFFGTRRHHFQFRVKVPSDWGAARRLVWTLTVRGRTEKANGFLLPEWEIGNEVITASFAGIRSASERNKAPEITLGPDQAITLPKAATLTASVSDDGLPLPPKPRPARPGAGASAPAVPAGGAGAANADAAGGSRLRVEWITWRRPAGGIVKFDPATSLVTGGKAPAATQPQPVINGKAVTTASFGAPGRYVLKGIAFDGAVTVPSAGVTVTVHPAP